MSWLVPVLVLRVESALRDYQTHCSGQPLFAPKGGYLPEPLDDGDQIKIDCEVIPMVTTVIVDENGQQNSFKMLTKTPMTKVFDVIAEKKSGGIDSLRFLYNGRLIFADETPETLNLKALCKKSTYAVTNLRSFFLKLRLRYTRNCHSMIGSHLVAGP